jgi:iron complex transport system permease protein
MSTASPHPPPGSAQWRRRRTLVVLGLLVLLGLAAFVDVWFGTVALPPAEILAALLGQEVDERVRILVLESRVLRMGTAAAVGAALALSGLLMQSFFRNPVAGPYLLGVSSGASLGVALVVLGSGSALLLPLDAAAAALPLRVMAAAIGAALMMGLMAVLALRVRDLATLLIIGLMAASFLSACVGILQYFAAPEALRDFIFWTFGKLDLTHLPQVRVLLGTSLIGLLVAWSVGPSLDVLLLGEGYARSMGLRIQRMRLLIVALTALLAGTCTAYCGPIAFIGIAVPHAVRGLVGQAPHRFLLPTTALAGASLLLLCDALSRLPFLGVVLPINAVTSILGAPTVVAIVWRMRKKGLLV